jgi:hypothetical protein
MPSFNQQISFKVAPQIAAQLEALGKERKLSRGLVAKQFVLASLKQHRPVPEFDQAIPKETTPAPIASLGPDQLSQLVDAVAAAVTARMASKDSSSLEPSAANLQLIDLVSVRRDIRRLADAFFCHTGMAQEKAREWTDRLFPPLDRTESEPC